MRIFYKTAVSDKFGVSEKSLEWMVKYSWEGTLFSK